MPETSIQVLGILAFIAGLFLVTGRAWTLLITGVLATAVGVAFEIKGVKNAG